MLGVSLLSLGVDEAADVAQGLWAVGTGTPLGRLESAAVVALVGEFELLYVKCQSSLFPFRNART